MNSQQPSWGARGVFTTIVQAWILIIGVAIAYGLAALAYSWWSTPIYQASATLYVTSGSGSAAGSSSFDAVRASQERAATYGKLLYSDAVIAPAIERAELDMSVSDAKNNLQVDVDPAVMTMTISATDPDPLVAQSLANAISDSLADAVSTLDVPSGGGSPAARLTVVNTAEVGADPIWPKMYLGIGIAAGVGLIAGLCLALLLEKTNNRLRDEADAEVALDERVLATLPATDGPDTVIDFDHDRGATAAAYRTLRTGYMAATRDAPAEVFAVTSPRPGAGTTAVAVNLAGALAHAGHSTVIVDANLSDPQITEVFGVHNASGLTDVVGGQAGLDAAVQTIDENLCVLGVGTQATGNSTDLLSSRAFGQLLNELADRCDYVVVDTPPILENLDTAACATWLKGVLVVVPHKSRLSDLRQVRVRLDQLDTRLIGVVTSKSGAITDRQLSATDRVQGTTDHRDAPEEKAPRLSGAHQA